MSGDPLARLARQAAAQHSVFTRAQALAAGVSPKMVRTRTSRGVWVPLHRGVYVDASVRVGWRQRVMAACLASGPEAVASHRSASLVWGLVDDVETPEVTVASHGVRDRPGIVVHRSARLEAVVHQGFRVTNPMRTILDLAGCEPEAELERVLDKAHTRGLIDLRRLGRYVDLPFNASRQGSRVVRSALDTRDADRPIESDIETVLFRLLRRGGLPLPVKQHPVGTRNGRRRVDFAYPEHSLALEVDGYSIHGGRRAFELDRMRQNDLEELGWRVLRFTARQLRSDPVGVVVSVGTAIGLAPARWKRTAKGR